jgi:hypothetical protein
MSDQLNARNIQALAQGLRLVESRSHEHLALIKQLQEQITTLNATVNNLTVQVAVLRAKNFTSGSSA